MIENYVKITPGHWYQEYLTGSLPDYTASYSKTRYDTYNTNLAMSTLRYNVITQTLGDFNSVLDFGYGNGSFMEYCRNQNKKVFGYDISDYPVPEGTEKIDLNQLVDVDVMTFFDSLEHIPEKNLSKFLIDLNTKFVCISVPWFHESQGALWFTTWKHRRENEHLHHFDTHGLISLLLQSGYKIIHVGNDEDIIRKPETNLPNILTIVAKKL